VVGDRDFAELVRYGLKEMRDVQRWMASFLGSRWVTLLVFSFWTLKGEEFGFLDQFNNLYM
jgi:hypothetical protein